VVEVNGATVGYWLALLFDVGQSKEVLMECIVSYAKRADFRFSRGLILSIVLIGLLVASSLSLIPRPAISAPSTGRLNRVLARSREPT